MTSIYNIACEEHVVAGQCTYNFSLFFVNFRKKYAKFNFSIDMNFHALPLEDSSEE